MKTMHIITRLIIGGAQENTLFTCEDQTRDHGDEVTLVIGPDAGPEGSLLDRARDGGYRVEVLNELRRSIRPWSDLKAYRRLRSLMRECAPEIVHTHSSKAGVLGRAAAHRLKLPCVHTIHGAAFHYGQSWLSYNAYVQAEKWAANRSRNFISVCDAMTHTYVDAGIAPAENFTTIYSGFDLEPFLRPTKSRSDVRSELGFTDTDVVVATIARLFNLKGHETLLDVAPRIVSENPNIKFLWIGDGVLREQYEARIEEMGLSEHFVLTGLVCPERVPELLPAVDLLAHPSQWEGLARVLPQAMIAGKPCVSYDVGGASEVVLDATDGGIDHAEQTGRLVDLNDSSAMATAILQLAADPSLRHALGQRGRDLCDDLFDHRHMTKRIREVYARIIDEHYRKV